MMNTSTGKNGRTAYNRGYRCRCVILPLQKRTWRQRVLRAPAHWITQYKISRRKNGRVDAFFDATVLTRLLIRR